MSPIIRLFGEKEYFVLYSGQNDFVQNMRFFDELKFPHPKHLLSWDMREIEKLFYVVEQVPSSGLCGNRVFATRSPFYAVSTRDRFSALLKAAAADIEKCTEKSTSLTVVEDSPIVSSIIRILLNLGEKVQASVLETRPFLSISSWFLRICLWDET
jgi:hypothetical protein